MLSSSEHVKDFYELITYPNYPLWFTPRKIKNYVGSSSYAAKVCGVDAGLISDPKRVLVIGCGEIQPYVMRNCEALKTELYFLDVSEKSLKRARFRMLRNWRASVGRQFWICENFLDYAERADTKFDHIDAFGVLHHLQKPEKGVAAVAKLLKAGGTARVMVYNSVARAWIHEIQDDLAAMKLDFRQKNDVLKAMQYVKTYISRDSQLRQLIANIGPTLFKNHSRFIDTFMHVCEARLTWSQWFDIFTKNDLTVCGLYDRYQELTTDPILNISTLSKLADFVAKREFLGNFEVYLRG